MFNYYNIEIHYSLNSLIVCISKDSNNNNNLYLECVTISLRKGESPQVAKLAWENSSLGFIEAVININKRRHTTDDPSA